MKKIQQSQERKGEKKSKSDLGILGKRKLFDSKNEKISGEDKINFWQPSKDIPKEWLVLDIGLDNKDSYQRNDELDNKEHEIKEKIIDNDIIFDLVGEEKEDPIVTSVCRGEIEKVAALYKEDEAQKADWRKLLQTCDKQGSTLLILAIISRNRKMIDMLIAQYLLAINYDSKVLAEWVNVQNESGIGAIHIAITQKNTYLVKLLLAAGVDPTGNYTCSSGEKMPLFNLAASYSAWEIMRVLLEYGTERIDINAIAIGDTPITSVLTGSPKRELSKTRTNTILKLLELPGINVNLEINHLEKFDNGEYYKIKKTALSCAFEKNAKIFIIKKILSLRTPPLIDEEWLMALKHDQDFPRERSYLQIIEDEKRFGTFPSHLLESASSDKMQKNTESSEEEKIQFLNRLFHSEHYYYVPISQSKGMEDRKIEQIENKSATLVLLLNKVEGEGNCMFLSCGITRNYWVSYIQNYYKKWEKEEDSKARESFKELRQVLRNDLFFMLDGDLANLDDGQIKRRKDIYSNLFKYYFGSFVESPYSKLVDLFLKCKENFLQAKSTETHYWEAFDSFCYDSNFLLSYLQLYRCDGFRPLKLWPSMELMVYFAKMQQTWVDDTGQTMRYIFWQQKSSKSREVSLVYPSSEELDIWLNSDKPIQSALFHIANVHFNQLIPLDSLKNKPQLIHKLCIEAAANHCYEPIQIWYKNDQSLALAGLRLIFTLFINITNCEMQKIRDDLLKIVLHQANLSLSEILNLFDQKEQNLLKSVCNSVSMSTQDYKLKNQRTSKLPNEDLMVEINKENKKLPLNGKYRIFSSGESNLERDLPRKKLKTNTLEENPKIQSLLWSSPTIAISIPNSASSSPISNNGAMAIEPESTQNIKH